MSVLFLNLQFLREPSELRSEPIEPTEHSQWQ